MYPFFEANKSGDYNKRCFTLSERRWGCCVLS